MQEPAHNQSPQVSPQSQPDSLGRRVLDWVIMIIAFAFLIRLALAAIRFIGTAFSRILESNGDLEPLKLFITIAVLVIVTTILVISKRQKKAGSSGTAAGNNGSVDKSDTISTPR
jgi:hypothetical protein